MFPSLYHHEIFRSYYQWQIFRSYYHAKGQGQRSKVKVTEVMTPFPDHNSSLDSHVVMKWGIKLDVAKERCPFVFEGHPSNFKVTQLKRSLSLTQIGRFRIVTLVRIHQWLWNDAWSLKQHRRGALLFFKVIRQISRSHGTINRRFWPNWAFSDCNFSLTSPMAMKWCTKLEAT